MDNGFIGVGFATIRGHRFKANFKHAFQRRSFGLSKPTSQEWIPKGGNAPQSASEPQSPNHNPNPPQITRSATCEFPQIRGLYWGFQQTGLWYSGIYSGNPYLWILTQELSSKAPMTFTEIWTRRSAFEKFASTVQIHVSYGLNSLKGFCRGLSTGILQGLLRGILGV